MAKKINAENEKRAAEAVNEKGAAEAEAEIANKDPAAETLDADPSTSSGKKRGPRAKATVTALPKNVKKFAPKKPKKRLLTKTK